MTAREALGLTVVGLFVVAAPGLAGMLGTALTGVSDVPSSSAAAGRGSPSPQTQPSAEITPRQRRSAEAASRSRVSSTPTGSPLPSILLRIRTCESHGDYRAENAASTASGAYQILDSTWQGYRGYARALYAPPAVQDGKALALYLDRGTEPWMASEGCWS